MDLRYPIGKYTPNPVITPAEIERWIDQIAELPGYLRQAVSKLDDARLDSPYRPEGWTLRQVVHHLADSHLNSLIRFKLALTEEEPTIKPYDEVAWAQLADYQLFSVDQELDFIALLHARWVVLLRSLAPADFERTYRHPESGVKRLDWTVGLYAWHGRHHLAHITTTMLREGW